MPRLHNTLPKLFIHRIIPWKWLLDETTKTFIQRFSPFCWLSFLLDPLTKDKVYIFYICKHQTSKPYYTVLRNNSFLQLFLHTWVGGVFISELFCFSLENKLSRHWVFLSRGFHSMSGIVEAGIFTPMPVTW